MKILIVEDDFVSRKFMTKFLSKYGACQTAEDGEQAVKMYKDAVEQQRPYDLICLDIVMPRMDGYKTLELIRSYEEEKGIAAQEGVKVIMTTGMEVGTNITKAFELGCVAYTSKPIDIVQFDGLLHQLQLI
ncbi:MAG: response regulator [Bacteroides sp.]|nr:response regulator [Bacteroides sp.]MCM1550142.1 response regulator [Clostridium sp.]